VRSSDEIQDELVRVTAELTGLPSRDSTFARALEERRRCLVWCLEDSEPENGASDRPPGVE